MAYILRPSFSPIPHMRTTKEVALPRPMISIVDDDLLVRDAMVDLVASLGYEARAFASAEEFLTSGHMVGTSCLITDLHMPGLNGLDLQSRVLAEGHGTRMIFITAFPR